MAKVKRIIVASPDGVVEVITSACFVRPIRSLQSAAAARAEVIARVQQQPAAVARNGRLVFIASPELAREVWKS